MVRGSFTKVGDDKLVVVKKNVIGVPRWSQVFNPNCSLLENENETDISVVLL